MQRNPTKQAVETQLRVRLAADPASVPGARRFIADGLMSWGLEDLVDDATLCVSELAGNAALHSSSTFMRIAMRFLGGAVRISVEDNGAVPVAALVPRSRFPAPGDEPDVVLLEDEPTTGRGLAIVSILARDWGVERVEGGKRVWADITDDTVEHGLRPPQLTSDVLPEPSGGALPDGWVLVRLAGCPVRLSLRQDEHLDELIRELQLITADRDNARSQALAVELQGLLRGPAHARHTGRRIAQAAAAVGEDYIEVDMAMPREFSADVQELHEAVKAADVLCEDIRLLTLASSTDLRALRAWMTEQLVQQIEHGAAAVSWTDWLEERV